MRTECSHYCCGAYEVGLFEGSKEDIVKYLEDMIEYYHDADKAFLFATTIPSQKAAIEALIETGFLFTPAMCREDEEYSSPITLWYLPLARVIMP